MHHLDYRQVSWRRSLVGAVLTVFVSSVHASNELTKSQDSSLPLPGQEVEQMLAIQRSGEQQSALPQSVSSAYHEKAAQRFMKTLDQAIPAASSGASSQGSASR